MVHPFEGTIQEYNEQLDDPRRHRPRACPLCRAKKPLRAHGFYARTLVAEGFDGLVRMRRYLCRLCRRTISLLPDFALPYIRFAVPVIGRFLRTRLSEGRTLAESARAAGRPEMSHQRGQHWVRRFRDQAEPVAAALSGLIRPAPAADFIRQALDMLEAAGWIPSHRFLLSEVRVHLLGWPRCLAPDGRARRFVSPRSVSAGSTHTICLADGSRDP
jgi:transposase-like protein